MYKVHGVRSTMMNFGFRIFITGLIYIGTTWVQEIVWQIYC